MKGNVINFVETCWTYPKDKIEYFIIEIYSSTNKYENI